MNLYIIFVILMAINKQKKTNVTYNLVPVLINNDPKKPTHLKIKRRKKINQITREQSTHNIYNPPNSTFTTFFFNLNKNRHIKSVVTHLYNPLYIAFCCGFLVCKQFFFSLNLKTILVPRKERMDFFCSFKNDIFLPAYVVYVYFIIYVNHFEFYIKFKQIGIL